MGSRIEMKVLEDSSDGKKEISDYSDVTFDDLYVIDNLYYTLYKRFIVIHFCSYLLLGTLTKMISNGFLTAAW